MSAAWAGVIVGALVVVAMFLGWQQRQSRREGKVDTLLERLTEIAEDHEERLRRVEPRVQSIDEFLHGRRGL